MNKVATEQEIDIKGHDQIYQNREIKIGQIQLKVMYYSQSTINPDTYSESLSLKFNDDTISLDVMRAERTEKARVSIESTINPQRERIKELEPETREIILSLLSLEARSLLDEVLE